MPSQNGDRIFDEVLSLEAWRSEFDAIHSVASIHVDASFLRAKLGDEEESPIRFELYLKRAEIIFVIPTNEPLKVIQKSVAREEPLKGISTIVQNNSQKSNLTLAGLIGTASPPAVIAAGKIASNTGSSVELELQGRSSEFISRQYINNGNYCWEVTPSAASKLIGKIWDPVSEPRLSVKHMGTRNKNISPICRVMVSCKREDIVIDNISFKGKSLTDRFKANRNAAAAAFVRSSLANKGLDPLNFEEEFSDILIADVIVDEEVT